MTDDLKPCPNCGGQPRETTTCVGQGSYLDALECCGLRVTQDYLANFSACDRWNALPRVWQPDWAKYPEATFVCFQARHNGQGIVWGVEYSDINDVVVAFEDVTESMLFGFDRHVAARIYERPEGV